jgi:hypothetical protein
MKKKHDPMRTVGWTVTLVVGGYATYVLVKSIPDIARYVKLSMM